MIDPDAIPWSRAQTYRFPGKNGLPATYQDIMLERAAGAAACDNNQPLTDCPHNPSGLTDKAAEEAQFLADVWKASWRRRRKQILAAQLKAREGQHIPGM